MTSSTTDLIAEARAGLGGGCDCGNLEPREVHDLLDRLADALEAATSEIEARPQRFVICEHCNHQQRIRSAAPRVVAAINNELTKRAGWHPQSRGRGYSGLCNAASHSQLVNVPCETARQLAWLYDLLEHPLGPCPDCKGHGWNWGDGKDEFNKVACERCGESGLRGDPANALVTDERTEK